MASVTKLSLVGGLFPAAACNSISGGLLHNESINSEKLGEANDILSLVNELTKAIELLEATVRHHGREIKGSEILQADPAMGKHLQTVSNTKSAKGDSQLPLHIIRKEKVSLRNCMILESQIV